jgi:hypothetical protein
MLIAIFSLNITCLLSSDDELNVYYVDKSQDEYKYFIHCLIFICSIKTKYVYMYVYGVGHKLALAPRPLMIYCVEDRIII